MRALHWGGRVGLTGSVGFVRGIVVQGTCPGASRPDTQYKKWQYIEASRSLHVSFTIDQGFLNFFFDSPDMTDNYESCKVRNMRCHPPENCYGRSYT